MSVMQSLEFEERYQQRKSSGELVGLTSGFAGLQIAFSIQFALLTDALSSLGFSRASISAIWLIPPICGAIVQPLLGAWSDVFSNRWGRRRPFIVGGAIGLSASLLAFGEVVTLLLIFTINVSATAIQMGLRALMVDACSEHQQSEVNAWMARLTNAANVFCYLLAYIDLPSLLKWAGQTQLQIITRLSVILIGTTQGITCWCARHESRFYAPSSKEVRLSEGRNLQYWWNRSNMKLSRRLWIIQGVQFLSWFAWFPFLTYISSYVDHLSKEEILESSHSADTNPISCTPQAVAYNRKFEDKYGPSALLCFASVALLTTAVVPLTSSWLSSRNGSLFERGHMESQYQSNDPRVSARWKRHMWYLSQLLYAASLVGILLVRSAAISIVFVGMAGISWAITQWIPFTLINVEILRCDQDSGACRPKQAASVQSLSNVTITAPQIMASLFGMFVFSYSGDTKDGLLVLGTRLIFVACSFVSFLAACLLLQLDVT